VPVDLPGFIRFFEIKMVEPGENTPDFFKEHFEVRVSRISMK